MIFWAVNPVTGVADQRTVPAGRDVPESTVTVVCPVMLPAVAVSVTWPAATPWRVLGLPLTKLAMVESLTDHVASGRRVPVWSTAVKDCCWPMSMLMGPGVTVRVVGAERLTVTLSVDVDTFPATSVAFTTTELDTENSG